jgi:hypothetical protein
MTQKQRFDDLMDLDWLQPPHIFVLITIFAALRIPMLFLGFGLDPDAWRIANAAFDLRNHFIYHTSRFPGYPLPELVNALFIDFGWTATNSITMVLSLLSALTFAYLLKHGGFKNKGLLTVTYAFTPLLWINSTNTMDYMWALSFILFTWYFLVRSKYVTAGIMMGLAVGSRPPTILLLIPFLYLLISHRVDKKRTVFFILACLLTAAMLFLPVYLKYGLAFLHQYPPRTTLLQIGYQVIRNFGLPSIIILLILLATSSKNCRTLMLKPQENDHFILLSVITLLASFVIAPYHFEYLIPMIPFGLILISRIGKKTLLALFCCLSILHAIFAFGSVQYTETGRIRIRAADYGAVYNNMTGRRRQLSFARDISQTEVEMGSVVLVGHWLPIIAYLGEDISSTPGTKRMFDSNAPQEGVWNFERDTWYRYLIDLDELNELQDAGHMLYYVTGIRDYTLEIYGYDLLSHGASRLPLH